MLRAVSGSTSASAVGVTSSLRQIATRSRISTNIGGGIPQSQSRTRHFASANMSVFQVVYSNWYNAGPADTGTGATISIACGVEYPVGVFTQVLFGGSATGSIASGTNIISDPITLNIPKGAEFFLRPYVSGATNGVPFAKLGNGDGGWFYDSANGERSEFGSSVANHSMGGVIADMQAGILMPSAIIGISSAPAPAFIGDSRVGGLGDSFTNIKYSYIGELERVLGFYGAFINLGINGESAQNFGGANRALSRALVTAYCTQLISDFGGDLRNGVSAAQTIIYLKAIRDLFPTMPMTPANCSPVTTSTDGWTTLNNQTVTSNETERNTFNTTLAQGQDFDGYLNIAGYVTGTTTGGPGGAGNAVWLPFYTVDGIHMNQIGNRIYTNNGALTGAVLA